MLKATIQILQKLESTSEWKSYIYGSRLGSSRPEDRKEGTEGTEACECRGEYAFHYIVDQTLNLWPGGGGRGRASGQSERRFVCMAERLLGRRIPFGFLQAVQERKTADSTCRVSALAVSR